MLLREPPLTTVSLTRILDTITIIRVQYTWLDIITTMYLTRYYYYNVFD